jgi:excisionase family DNA binding protein
MQNEKELYAPREVAQLCGVSAETVVDWARAGKIESVRTIGGHRRFTRRAVREVLRRQGYPIPAELQEQEQGQRLPRVEATRDELLDEFEAHGWPAVVKFLGAIGIALPQELLEQK